MYIILGVIAISIGLVMVISPKLYYDNTQKWKHNSETESSDEYISMVRFGGVIVIIVATILVISQYVE